MVEVADEGIAEAGRPTGQSAPRGYGHLAPGVAKVLEWGVEERVAYARADNWVGYPRAVEALKVLSDLLAAPRATRVTGLLLCGRSGNGKSMILDRFRKGHPLTSRIDGATTCPVVAMDMPAVPTETRFWTALLDAAGIAHRDTDPALRKQQQAMSALAYLQCRMLIIDEFHNLNHGQANHQRQLLAVLKNLVNALALPIVVAGTKAAVTTVQTDSQVERRFEDFGLPKWAPDRDYQRMLKGFESLMPLPEPSNLADPVLAADIQRVSGPTIRGTAATVKKLAMIAIRSGRDRIEPDMLHKVPSNEPEAKSARAQRL